MESFCSPIEPFLIKGCYNQIGMKIFVHGNPDDVTKAVNHIMSEATKSNRKHIVAASDYLVSDVKEENVKALCDAVKNYNV